MQVWHGLCTVCGFAAFPEDDIETPAMAKQAKTQKQQKHTPTMMSAMASAERSALLSSVVDDCVVWQVLHVAGHASGMRPQVTDALNCWHFTGSASPLHLATQRPHVAGHSLPTSVHVDCFSCLPDERTCMDIEKGIVCEIEVVRTEIL